jgi:tetratricopeptide (TPR) repeat protein
MMLLGQVPSQENARQFVQSALLLLDQALKEDPHDWKAWEARGDTFVHLGQPNEALEAYRLALREQPESETTLHASGQLCLNLHRLAESRFFLERAVNVNPWRWEFHFLLAAVSHENREWSRAASECQESLRLEPFNSTTRRKMLITCLVHLGEKEKAKAEFEILLQLSPDSRKPDLVRWFEQQQP